MDNFQLYFHKKFQGQRINTPRTQIQKNIQQTQVVTKQDI